METKLITYNLSDRGREFRGADRYFDIPAIVNAINSPACQERVRKRDMLGYFGHWPRMKFGLNPTEGGLEKGRAVILTPALVTTHLKAYPDGTIEHQAEFLKTDAGIVASKMYESEVGGFSSAISLNPPEFWGFDYVNEPNYSTNRGWALDSVDGMSQEDVLDAIQAEQLQGAAAIIKKITFQRDMYEETINHLTEENERLLSALEKGGGMSAIDSVPTLPVACDESPADRMRRDAALFRGAQALPGYENLKEVKERTSEEKAAAALDSVHMSLFQRMFGM